MVSVIATDRGEDFIRPSAGVDSSSRLVERVTAAAVALPFGELVERVRSMLLAHLPVEGCDISLTSTKPRGPSEALSIPLVAHGEVFGCLTVTSAAVSPVVMRQLGGVANVLALAAAGHVAALRRSTSFAERVGADCRLADYDRHLAVANERVRIAQDLHDSVGQVVSAIGLRISGALSESSEPAWRSVLNSLLELTSRADADLRVAIGGLLHTEPQLGNLNSSLETLCRVFTTTTGLLADFEIAGAPVPLGPAKDELLFRVAREALANVDRHAHASSVQVRLSCHEDCVALSISDDGVGLRCRDPLHLDGHFGLRTLAQRIEDVGGEFVVTSAIGRGVAVVATVPLRRRDRRAARTRRGG